jgi:hypothetical protein
MARQDHTDGSQYDFDPPWDQDRLLANLEDVLTAIDTTDDPLAKSALRETATSLAADLVALHGIDLGPF